MLDSRPMQDPEEIRRHQSSARSTNLRWVMLGIALLMSGMATVDHWLAPPGESRSFISLSMGGLALLAFLSFRAHQRWWGMSVLVLGVLVSSTWATYSYGSIRAAAALALPGAVVLAGAYLGQGMVVVTAVVAALALGGLTWAETQGLLATPGLAADFRYWSMGSVILVVTGVVLHHMRRVTDESHLRHLYQMEDRVRLEYERDRSLLRSRRIFHLNPTALVIHAADTLAVLEVNPAFERLFGFEGLQLVGRKADTLWADHQQWQAHCQALASQGQVHWQSARWLRADGKSLDVLVSSELTEDHDGPLVLSTVADLR